MKTEMSLSRKEAIFFVAFVVVASSAAMAFYQLTVNRSGASYVAGSCTVSSSEDNLRNLADISPSALPTDSSSPIPSSSPSITPSPYPTETPSASPIITPSPVPSTTPSSSPVVTSSPTPTSTPCPSPKPSPSPSPTTFGCTIIPLAKRQTMAQLINSQGTQDLSAHPTSTITLTAAQIANVKNMLSSSNTGSTIKDMLLAYASQKLKTDLTQGLSTHTVLYKGIIQSNTGTHEGGNVSGSATGLNATYNAALDTDIVSGDANITAHFSGQYTGKNLYLSATVNCSGSNAGTVNAYYQLNGTLKISNKATGTITAYPGSVQVKVSGSF